MNINAVIAELQRAIEASLRWEDRAGAEEARSIARGIVQELVFLEAGFHVDVDELMADLDELVRIEAASSEGVLPSFSSVKAALEAALGGQTS